MEQSSYITNPWIIAHWSARTSTSALRKPRCGLHATQVLTPIAISILNTYTNIVSQPKSNTVRSNLWVPCVELRRCNPIILLNLPAVITTGYQMPRLTGINGTGHWLGGFDSDTVVLILEKATRVAERGIPFRQQSLGQIGVFIIDDGPTAVPRLGFIVCYAVCDSAASCWAGGASRCGLWCRCGFGNGGCGGGRGGACGDLDLLGYLVGLSGFVDWVECADLKRRGRHRPLTTMPCRLIL